MGCCVTISFAEFLPIVWQGAGAHKIAVAVAVQVALYAANIWGLREGRALQEVTSLIKAAMLFVFIIAAIVFVAPPEPRPVALFASQRIPQAGNIDFWRFSWCAALIPDGTRPPISPARTPMHRVTFPARWAMGCC